MTPQDTAKGWLRQARNDLVHARWSLQAGHTDWACLAAHHAAEKALKGLALDAGHRPLATNNPALLAMDLIELGIIREAEIAHLGDLETLGQSAARLRDPGHLALTEEDRHPEASMALAHAAVSLTEQVLGLVSAAAHDSRMVLGGLNGGPDTPSPAARDVG